MDAETSIQPAEQAGDSPPATPGGGTGRRPVVDISQVDKVYGNDTRALDKVDLTVRQGDFISLLGPSGCGKSTLLRIVAGLSKATGGDVKWWEQDYGVVGQPGRELCFVFQSPTLMPWARLDKNVRLPLDLKHVKKSDSTPKVRDALKMVGLGEFEQSYPRELSGGMQMRASIARALVTDPSLCLMDEPFGALDEMTRNRLNDDILRLWQERNWTVIFVTHSVYEAVYLSNRIAVMAPRPGRIADELTIDAPYPRGNDFRNSDAYAEYCRRASHALGKVSS